MSLIQLTRRHPFPLHSCFVSMAQILANPKTWRQRRRSQTKSWIRCMENFWHVLKLVEACCTTSNWSQNSACLSLSHQKGWQDLLASDWQVHLIVNVLLQRVLSAAVGPQSLPHVIGRERTLSSGEILLAFSNIPMSNVPKKYVALSSDSSSCFIRFILVYECC